MIHKLFKYLGLKNIDYAVISGYEKLFDPDNLKGDIDILIRKKDFLTIELKLKGFCYLEGYEIVQIYHHEVYAKNIFIFDPKTQQLLNLDLYGKLHRKETQFYTEDELFRDRSSFLGISTLSMPHEFIHYLIKKIDKNGLTLKPFYYLKQLFDKDEEGCIDAINKCFTRHHGIIISAFINNYLPPLIENLSDLKASIYINKKVSFRILTKKGNRFFKRIFHPTGMTICFLGPDGSGKSTIIEALKEQLLPFRKTAYYHLKPINSKSTNSSPITNPHENEIYSKTKSFLKLIYFVYQYNLGWLKNIVTQKIRSTLIIFDRYYDDLKIDHKRFRYGGPKNWINTFEYFIPKPSLYFVLSASPETIYARKQEVPFNVLEEQIHLYDQLKKPIYYHINVDRPPKEIVKEVYHILMSRMYERY